MLKLNTAARLALALLTLSTGSAALAQPAGAQASAAAQSPATGAYRIDALREGVHEGAPVRFLDLTLRNTSPHATTSQGVVDVWWQGRGRGESVKARRRDLSAFGMYDFVKAGEVLPVTFIVPLRSDITGVEIDVAHPAPAPRSRAGRGNN